MIFGLQTGGQQALVEPATPLTQPSSGGVSLQGVGIAGAMSRGPMDVGGKAVGTVLAVRLAAFLINPVEYPAPA